MTTTPRPRRAIVCIAIGISAVVSSTAAHAARAGEPFPLDRCEIVPLAEHRVSFRIDGVEKLRWNFGSDYPRPFFYPFNGPSGSSLTRMGHPGASNHDHHLSVWFAHQDVDGLSFWSNTTDTTIRQKMWYRYRDGNDEALMASLSGWYDVEGNEHLEQDVVAALRPMDDGEHALEVQITMRPGAKRDRTEIGQTNFGFFAVRVAKTISEHFGGGTLSSSEGQEGEPKIFGKQARWVDYSGAVPVGTGPNRKAVIEGITYFDHPSNPRYPTYWHVRSDGWMGASFSMHEPLTITAEEPLTLRYLLQAHRGPYDHAKAEAVHRAFAGRPGFRIVKSTQPNQQYEVERLAE